MLKTAGTNLLQRLSPSWLAGPIFDKELRVASRKRRYYLLRFAYVCLLMLMTLQVWYVVTQSGGTSAVVRMSRLGEAGQTIIVAVVWFQFVTAQLLAAVLLSDAISSELRQRTLEGLLVTPVGALHIVLGKLLSRLLQIVLLLAISLPVLAVVRVLGGVPWDFLVSGLCLTLSAAVFAGSLSLLYSTARRYAFQAVVVVGVWYLVIWVIVPGVLMSLSRVGYLRSVNMGFLLSLTDPCLALLSRTQALLRASRGATASAPLLWQCLTILAAAAFLLLLSVRKVRRLALVDRSGSSREAQAGRRGGRLARARQKRAREPIRRVQGMPLVWKELSLPRFQARREILFLIILWVAVAVFIFVAVGFFGPGVYAGSFIPIVILQWLFLIRLGVAAAGAVTREKEARTWPILLATPLSDAQIVKGKAWAAFRRNMLLLGPLALFYLLAMFSGPTHQLGPLLYLAMIAGSLAGAVVFLLGFGLYLSTRLKTTAGAVASTLGVYIAPKLFCCGVPGPLFLLSPGASGSPLHGSWAGTLAFAFVPSAIYTAVGLLCLRAAIRRVRRNVF